MRIAGYIEHPQLKITIFEMENRYALKIESEAYAQTYKLRKGDTISSVDDVRRFAGQVFLKKSLDILDDMHALKTRTMLGMAEDHEIPEEFPEII